MNKEPVVSLNYLRGIVTVAVMLAHANLLIDSDLFHGLLIQGWCGVDFFFILSGFLLYYNYQSHLNPKEYAVSYVKKRVIRIYPVYWIYSIIVLLTAVLIKKVLNMDLINWINLDFSGIARSLFCIITDNVNNERPIIPPAWTLPYEVFFYIVSLSLILGGKQIYKKVLAVWCVLIVFVNIVVPVNNFYIAFLFDTLFLEFVFGVLTAFLIEHVKNVPRNSSVVLLLTGIGALAVAWIGTNMGRKAFIDINRVVLFGIPFTIILIGVLFLEKTNNYLKIRGGRRKHHPVLDYLGKISFSLYLTHYIVIELVSRGTKRMNVSIPSLLLFLITSLTCLFVGIAAYEVVEKKVTVISHQILKEKRP